MAISSSLWLWIFSLPGELWTSTSSEMSSKRSLTWIHAWSYRIKSDKQIAWKKQGMNQTWHACTYSVVVNTSRDIKKHCNQSKSYSLTKMFYTEDDLPASTICF